MKISVDIPQDLLNEAMKLSGISSAEEVIQKALVEQISTKKRRKLLEQSGLIDMKLNLDRSRNRRNLG